ncbi:MAG: cyclase family protein [Candidatus Sericytochromatia bacterium]|nr:cyclase family protein [Candidatus Sericytochromatia bacterium]
MLAEGGWLDISRTLGPDTPVWPGDPPVRVTPHMTLDTGPCHVTRIELGSHSATHVDAPAHFVRGGATLGEIPLRRWSGVAWVIPLDDHPDIEPASLARQWPQGSGCDRVLLKTRASQGAGEAPALTLEAAAWLLERGVRLVGIDAASIERDDSGIFPVHHALLGADCLILEGLDLAGIVAGPYELVCLPLKLDAPDGAPARAVLRAL